jgi:tyrosine-protein phosphatase SIW14
MSRRTIHSAALFVAALTLVTAALALASFRLTLVSAPVFAARQDSPQQRVSQTPPAETSGCDPLEVDDKEISFYKENHSARSNATSLSNAAPGHVIPQRQKLPGLSDFGEVTPTLYRGGRPTEEGLARLAKMGVSIVISTEGSFKDLHKPVERLGMHYVSMGWECSFPRDHTFAKFLQLLRDNPGKKVFVYCHYGDDRTGMMIAAYRIAEQGWSAEEAKEEMKAFGFNFFHRRICTGLSDYEEHFPRHWREGHAFEKLRSTPSPQP